MPIAVVVGALLLFASELVRLRAVESSLFCGCPRYPRSSLYTPGGGPSRRLMGPLGTPRTNGTEETTFNRISD